MCVTVLISYLYSLFLLFFLFSRFIFLGNNAYSVQHKRREYQEKRCDADTDAYELMEERQSVRVFVLVCCDAVTDRGTRTRREHYESGDVENILNLDFGIVRLGFCCCCWARCSSLAARCVVVVFFSLRTSLLSFFLLFQFKIYYLVFTMCLFLS